MFSTHAFLHATHSMDFIRLMQGLGFVFSSVSAAALLEVRVAAPLLECCVLLHSLLQVLYACG
jgi:hypothetical protein